MAEPTTGFESATSGVTERVIDSVSSFFAQRAKNAGRHLISSSLAHPAAMVGVAFRTGGEFLPKLGEGTLVVNVIRLAGVDVDEAV